MSLAPQRREATGPSNFTIIARGKNQEGYEIVTVKGPYGKRTLEVGRWHEGCQYEGEMLGERGEWADIFYCSGCNYSIYYPLGD